jgi:hypothetical protein
VSDQDFFFDEDEKPAAKAPSKNAPAKKPASSSSAKGGSSSKAAAAPAPQQSVTYTIAALIGVAALLLGVIVGILLPVNIGGSTTATPEASIPGAQTQAPALTNEQMQSGALPPGHPNVGGTGSTGATGSATTTP